MLDCLLLHSFYAPVLHINAATQFTILGGISIVIVFLVLGILRKSNIIGGKIGLKHHK